MRDTTPEAAHLVRQLWSDLPAGRRLVLAAGMADTARALVKASFPPGLPAHELRIRLCARLYGDDLAARYRESVTGRPRR